MEPTWLDILQVVVSLVALVGGSGIAIGYTRFQDWRTNIDKAIDEIAKGQSKIGSQCQIAIGKADLNEQSVINLERLVRDAIPSVTERHNIIADRVGRLEGQFEQYRRNAQNKE